jgi:hypothetical protein
VTAGPGQALAVGFEGARIPDDPGALAERVGLGGVVLFARNCPSLDAVLALTAAARGLGPDVLVLVDHEGGRVHRLPPPFTHFPRRPPWDAPAIPALRPRAMARELRAAGFDSGLAPVLDCLLDPGCTVIGGRAFGADPEAVAACGVAFVEAMLSEGLLPVAKHFPGHGRASVDSHLALPDVDATVDDLERADLVPFRGPQGHRWSGRLPRPHIALRWMARGPREVVARCGSPSGMLPARRPRLAAAAWRLGSARRTRRLRYPARLGCPGRRRDRSSQEGHRRGSQRGAGA